MSSTVGPFPVPRKTVFTTGEVAAIFRTSIQRVDRWIDAGYLTGYRIPGTNRSGDRRVTRASLLAFVHPEAIIVADDACPAATAALDQNLYTTGEVARALHVCRKVVRQWIDRGHLRGFRLESGDRRVRHADLLAFAEKHGLILHLHPERKIQ